MLKPAHKFSLTLLILTAAASAFFGLDAISFSTEMHLQNEQRHTSTRPDGSELQWQTGLPDRQESVPLILVAQGSGCQATGVSRSMSSVAQAFQQDFAILMVEKYGVRPGDDPDEDNGERCSEAFYDKATISQRIDDDLQVLAELKDAPWWNGELVLFGGSEGGLTMAALSSRTSAKAAILISSIGDLSFGDIVLGAMEGQVREDAKRAFAAAKRSPSGSELFAGSSYAYWADAIDRTAKPEMLKSDAAFLIVQGSNNTQPSPERARAIADAFTKEKRCNVTYLELAGLDHSFIDAEGNNHLSEVTELSLQWLRLSLSGALSAKCTNR